jgi:hypothetical protein
VKAFPDACIDSKFFGRLLLTVCLLFLSSHRLPAPIVEEEKPTPAPKPRQASRSKPNEFTTVKAAAKKSVGMTDQSVEVVFTDTTRASLMHLRTYVETVEKIPFAPKSDVKPDEVTERLRQVLASRFRNVSIVSERSGSRSANGLIMVFDLQAHVGMTSGETNSVAVTATFKNGNGHVISAITASGSTKVPYPAWRTHFPEALGTAFAEFSQKLSTVRQ